MCVYIYIYIHRERERERLLEGAAAAQARGVGVHREHPLPEVAERLLHLVDHSYDYHDYCYY